MLLQIGVPNKEPATRNAAIQAEKPKPETASPKEEKQTFDFYQMLPNFEVVIPEHDKEVQRSGEVSKVEEPGMYVLQAGSFRNAEDADRLRAQLALVGLESDVQTVTIDRNQTWHRVRIGPFSNLDRLDQARKRLAENNIQALVIRVGETN